MHKNIPQVKQWLLKLISTQPLLSNCALFQELKANAIVQHRLRYGSTANESPSLLLMGAISQDTLDTFDFSIPTQVTTGTRMSLSSSFTAMEADLHAEIKETERSIKNCYP